MKKLLILVTILFTLSLNTFANDFEEDIVGTWKSELKHSEGDKDYKINIVANCEDKYFINKKANFICEFNIDMQIQDINITLLNWSLTGVSKWEIIDETLLSEILKVNILETPFNISNQEFLENFSKSQNKKPSDFKLKKEYKDAINHYSKFIKQMIYVGAIDSSKIDMINKKEMILITDGEKEHYFRK